MRVAALYAIVLCACAQLAFGSHYRYGNTNWKPVTPSDYTRTSNIAVRYVLMQGWRKSAFGSSNVGNTVNFGGSLSYGSGGSISLSGFRVTVADTTADWFAASKEGTHTFPGTGPYTGQWSSCCRIGSTPAGPLVNNANAGMRMWNTVDLRTFGSNVWKNSSPVSSQVPIQTVVRSQLNQWTMGSSDDDLDPLSYRLATSAEITGGGGGSQPSGFSIAPTSGLISFNVPSSVSVYYSTMIIISDGYCQIAVDYLMYAVQPVKYCACAPRCRTCSSDGQCAGSCTCQNNNAPVFIPPSPWLSGGLPTCFIPGTSTSFALAAQDAIDTCDNVFIASGDLPVGANLLPRTTARTNTRTYDFVWTSTLAQAGTHRVSFIPLDDANGIGTPASVELFVPSVAGTAALPNVNTWGPTTGESIASAAITMDGSNFIRGPNLRCSFKKVGAPDSAERLIRPVWLNNGNRVICVMPNEAELGDHGTRQVTVRISNFASCDVWRTLTPTFTFYDACPAGTFLSGPSCNSCPAGKYQATGNAQGPSDCLDCPAGRYGATAGLTTPLCTGQCRAGYYCLQGSTSDTSSKCPAGRFGDSPGLGNSGCTANCDAGYYCPASQVNTNARTFPCPAGRFGANGESSNLCAGICQAGYLCPAGSSNSQQTTCGAVTRFCEAGATAPIDVFDGFYSTGSPSVLTRTEQQECEEGFYCAGGQRVLCPAGRYGDQRGVINSQCNGPCSAGFRCPAGSSSRTALECGAGQTNPANVYCPAGSSVTTTVTNGFYSTPESNDPKQRGGQAACDPVTESCVLGIRYNRVSWTGVCSGDATGATGSFSWTENSNAADIVFSADQYESGSRGDVTYSLLSFASASGCPAAPSRSFTSPAGSPRTGVLEVGGGTFQPNFELCDEYTARVQARTPSNFLSVCEVTISVVDVNDPPVLCNTNLAHPECTATLASRLPYQMEENPLKASAVGGALHGQVVIDEDLGDEILYTIVSVSSNTGSLFTQPQLDGFFAIGSCSGQLTVATSTPSDLNFEAMKATLGAGVLPDFTIRVRVDDRALSNPAQIEFDVTLQVRDINEAPVFSPGSFWIEENSSGGDVVGPNPGEVDASDPDTFATVSSWTSLTYVITEQDGSTFEVGPTSEKIRVSSGNTLDFESLDVGQDLVSLRIRVSDGPGASDTQDFDVQILDVNDAPVLVDETLLLNELVPTGTVVGVIAAQDDESRTAGVTQMSWFIDSVHFGGRTASIAGHTSPFGIRRATAPRDTRLEAEIFTTGPIDYETLATYRLAVRVQDNGLDMSARTVNPQTYAALEDTAEITIKVQNVNEAPSFNMSSLVMSLNENTAAPFVITSGVLVADDPDKGPGGEPLMIQDPANPSDPLALIPNTFTYIEPTFALVAANAQFSVNRDSGAVTARTAFNFEAQAQYTFQVRTTDGALSDTQTLTVNVIDVNEKPRLTPGQSVSLDENSGSGVTVTGAGIAGTDVDGGDTQTYSLPAGVGNNLFTIDGSTGVLTTQSIGVTSGALAVFNHEREASITITVRVTDTDGLFDDGSVTVVVNDVNEAPVLSAAIQSGSVAESEPIGTQMGQVTASDVDDGDVLTFSLDHANPLAGSSTQCPNVIDGTSLNTATGVVTSVGVGPILASPEWCNYTVTVTDSGPLTDTGVFAVLLADVNQPVIVAATQTFSIPEDADVLTLVVPNLGASDADVQENLVYSAGSMTTVPSNVNEARPFEPVPGLVCNTDSPVECAGALRLIAPLDFERVSQYTLQVRITDTNPNPRSAITTLTLNILNVNEAPVITNAADEIIVYENTTTGTVVATAGVTDVDAGDTHTFISPAMQSEGIFAIAANGDISVVATGAARTAALNFESSVSYRYRVNVTDAGGLVDSQEFVLRMADVNEQPEMNVEPATAVSSTTTVNGAVTLNEGTQAVGGFDVVRQQTEIAALVADDADTLDRANDWGRLSYTITAGNSDNTWVATTSAGTTAGNDGALRLALQELDYEKFPSYDLTVVAEDGGGLSVTRPVRIDVVNHNDVSVSALSGPLNALSTDGGDKLILNGTNLGMYYNADATVQIRAVGTVLPADQTAYRVFPAGSYQATYVWSCVQIETNIAIECTTGPGAAKDLRLTVEVMLPAPASVTDTVTLSGLFSGSYQAPTITGVALASGDHTAMDTAGGQTVVLTGTQFPRASGEAVYVSYGSPGAAHQFHATACSVTVSYSEIQCTTTEGVGSNLVWSVAASGQWSSTFAGGSSYGVPSITGVAVISRTVGDAEFFVDFSATDENKWINPDGGDLIEITGSNFGPDLSALSVPGLTAVTPVVEYSRLVHVTTGAIESTQPGVSTATAAAGVDARKEAAEYVYSAVSCRVTVAHTTMRCTSVKGGGAALSPEVTVAGLRSGLIVGRAVTLHYRPARVTEIKGAGNTLAAASTEGKQRILMAADFLPRARDSRVMVTYGAAPNAVRYAATNCAVRDSGSQIECSTAPGVGKDWLFRVTVVDQLVSNPSGQFATEHSYNRPVVSNYTGPGAKDADTPGGQNVTILGNHFGPVGATDIQLVEYFDGQQDRLCKLDPSEPCPPRFTATACSVSVAHKQMTCLTGPGAGEGLRWELTVGHLVSSEVSSAYAAPELLDFSLNGGAWMSTDPSIMADNQGGELISLNGTNFGPTLDYQLASVPNVNEPFLDWVRYGPFDVLGATSDSFYEARNCTVVNHESIQCTTQPGTGGPFFWFVSIRGQVSSQETVLATFKFPDPTILSVEAGSQIVDGVRAAFSPFERTAAPRASTADDGELVRLVGRGFGIADRFANHTVLFGDKEITPSSMWYNSVDDVEVIEFVKPGGHGAGHRLQLRINALQPSALFTNELVWDYAGPDFSFSARQETVSIEKPDSDTIVVTLRSPNGAFCQPPSGLEGGAAAGAGLPPLQAVTRSTDSPLELCGQLYLDYTPSAPGSHIRDTPATSNFDQTRPEWGYVVPRGAFDKWTPDEVVFRVAAAPRNNLTVQIGNQVSTAYYIDVAPALRTEDCDALASEILPTNPMQPINITAANICDRDLTVKLQFTAGSFSSSTSNERECVITSPAFERPASADAVGVDTEGNPVCMTQCMPPAGQNIATIIITAGGLDTLDGCRIRYGNPTVTSATMTVDNRGVALSGAPRDVSRPYDIVQDGAASLYYFGPSLQNVSVSSVPADRRITLTLPTTGGVVRLLGSNFGEDGFFAGSALCAGASARSMALMRPLATAPGRDDQCLKFLPQNNAVAFGHNFHDVYIPSANGASRFVLALGVGGQYATGSFVVVRYEAPVVAAAPDGVHPEIATQGGVLLVNGSNFGDDASILQVDLVNADLPDLVCTSPRLLVDHRQIACDVPPGVGRDYEVYVTSAGIRSSPSAARMHFAAAVVTHVTPTEWPTQAGTLVTIHGANFLPSTLTEGALQSIILKPVSGSHSLTYMVPEPFDVNHPRGTLLRRGSQWVFHNATMIQFRTPNVQGVSRHMHVMVGNSLATFTVPNVISIQPPQLIVQEPSEGPTKGYLVKLVGRNFGMREASLPLLGNSQDTAMLDFPVRVGPLPSDHVTDLSLLTAKSNTTLSGLSNGIRVTTSPNGVASAPCHDVSSIWGSVLENNWNELYLHRVGTSSVTPPPKGDTPTPYAQDYFFCKIDAGYGRNRAMSLQVDDAPAVAFSFNYRTPFIRTTRPNTPNADGLRNWHIQGSDFGEPGLGITTAVSVNNIECRDVALNSSNLIECDTQRDVVGPKVVSVSAAGYSNITFPNVTLIGSGARIQASGVGHPSAAALVAQAMVVSSNMTAEDGAGRLLSPSRIAALFGAAEGSRRVVGITMLSETHMRMVLMEHDGEEVQRHPDAFKIPGPPTEEPADRRRARRVQSAPGVIGLQPGLYTSDDRSSNRINSVFKVQYHCPTGYWGQVGELCEFCPEGATCDSLCLASSGSICTDFTEPYSDNGWYALSVAPGNAECGRAARPYPYNTTCYDFVPCEPAESCLGNNTCGVGYEGLRCASCATGYFRVAGLCEPCPDLAWLYILLFAVMIVLVCVAGYVLNRYKVHLAFISIGVDYFQVLGMFANSRVEWPQFLRDLYRVLSIFQVNIDITAPECAIPNVSYSNKWFAIQMLPVVIGGLLLVIYLTKSAVDRFVLRLDAKHRGKHTPTMVAMAQLMMYYLYLLLTKTTFDAFNCQPTEPSDGKLYLEVEFVECYTPAHNEIFYPALFFTLPVYTIAYPIWVFWHLRRNKDKVKTDQILRAMGIGESKLTNPHYAFRQMFHKLYYHFKPGKWYWLLCIIFRKFCIALTGLLFRRTPAFQMAVAFLVLFFSFSIQVRHNPYMSMSERRGIILHHKSKAKEGNKKHQAIAAAYATAVRNANERQQARALNMDKVVASKGNLQQEYLFDYNTMEAVLLSCGVFVCLAGIMFQTGDDSPTFSAARQTLTVLTAMVIFVSLIYFFTVFGFEVWTTCGGGKCRSIFAKNDQDSKNKKLSGKDLKKAQTIDMEMENSSAMQMNPMALRATLKAEMERLDDILKSDGVPTKQQWEVVRMQATEVEKNLQELRWEAGEMKDKQETARRQSAATRGKNGKRRSILDRALGLNKSLLEHEHITPDMAEIAAIEEEEESRAPVVSPAELHSEAVQNKANPMLKRSGSFMAKGPTTVASPLAAAAVAEPATESAAAPAAAAGGRKKRRSSVAQLAAAKGDNDATWGSWTRCMNDEGLVWYHNSDTGESSYDMPAGFAAEGHIMWGADYTQAAAGASVEAILEGDEDAEESD